MLVPRTSYLSGKRLFPVLSFDQLWFSPPRIVIELCRPFVRLLLVVVGRSFAIDGRIVAGLIRATGLPY
jgi:hypothetical protein